MFFALVEGTKIEALPKAKGICPLCQRDVFAKCGEINVWHWAHQKGGSCDNWCEPETAWHKNWKIIFGKDFCEIIIKKEDVKHIADIRTQNDVVIELQNSPIQMPIIRRRENFYGERMLWIINGLPFKHNFIIHSSNPHKKQEYYWSMNYEENEHGTVDKNTGEIIPRPKKEFTFRWDWPRKSWSDVQRFTFIDFGDENLFWITEGMGTSHGWGREISKKDFLKKYGGDITLITTIISSQTR